VKWGTGWSLVLVGLVVVLRGGGVGTGEDGHPHVGAEGVKPRRRRPAGQEGRRAPAVAHRARHFPTLSPWLFMAATVLSWTEVTVFGMVPCPAPAFLSPSFMSD